MNDTARAPAPETHAGRRKRSLLLAYGEQYVRGLLAIAGVAVAFYAIYTVDQQLPDFGARGVNLAVALAVIVTVPAEVGWLSWKIMHPVLRRGRGSRYLLRAEERIVAEPSPDEERRGYQVVLVNWPSRELRSVGVVTNMIAGPDGEEYAAAYLPNVPGSRSSALRIVHTERTDWTLQNLLGFNFSYGSASPGALRQR